MHILGISCYFHDASAAILRDGALLAAAEEERFSRVKHDFGFPSRAIQFCLDEAGIRGKDLDYVAFFEKPFVKFDRILQTTFAEVPKSAAVFRQAITAWLLDKLWVKNRIREALGIDPQRILFVEHHQSHAASAFFCSPFEEAAILTVDGVGEWATATTGCGRDRTVDLTHEIHFPHSLGLLYSAFTAFLGFEVNEGEYKVMGMAPYGRPRFVEEVRKLLNVAPDGSFSLNLEYFEFQHSTTRTYSDAFVKLFGAPRPVESLFFTEASGFPSYFGDKPSNYAELAATNQGYADLAASIQAVTEETLLTMARAACERAGTTRLCMAGGVALNSVANGRILREAGVTDLFIQPAAGDSGAALGAALFVYHQVLGHPRGFVMQHASWGARHSMDTIRAAAGATGFRSEECPDEDRMLDRAAELIADGRVIGWHQGRFEWGPRALGHRSILADPRRAEMKDTVNVKIKFREPYRPFAPSVIEEAADRYFDTAGASAQYPARFMLLVEPVRPEARSLLPATTHIDNSARLQTVLPGPSPRYHELITRVGRATGVPVVMNTSFNLRGEPIVNTPAEAISTFARSGLDALVMDKVILHKDHL
ncbi:MAG TPA: carbamoyltransferase [Vicinamibacterales bacterium]|nr:carbamoyltransferase [Vicinamibacterales bacterium]